MRFGFRMTVGKRLGSGFAAMLALIVIAAAVGAFRLDEMARQTRRLSDVEVERYALAMQWRRATEVNAMRTIALLKSSDLDFDAQIKKEMDATSKEITVIQKKLESTIETDEGKALLAHAGERRAAYLKARASLTRRREDGEGISAATLASDLRPALDAYLGVMREIIDREKAEFDKGSVAAAQMATSGKKLMVGIGMLAVVLACVLAWATTRTMVRRLREAGEVARKVAAGDLTVRTTARGRDEIGELLDALSEMTVSVERTVAAVRSSADSIASASTQIAQGNQDLSSRTEEQASALEETAASMEELGSTVKQNAENARQANQLALGASGVAAKGGDVVGQVVETMKSINDSSKQIADIISVIDGIAFQTNILALNAAVEAARAGEQGRGFAVVAGEVRSLAQRSAEAAKEIKGLITTSVERVEHGTVLVDEAGETMKEVVTAIRRVTDIMGEISAASAEQSSGVAQVADAVSQMDQATQQNAALVEESAAAAASLRQQAHHLVEAVAVFKVDGASAHAPAHEAGAGWDGQNRRGPNRATNVQRIQPAKAAARPASEARTAQAHAGATSTASAGSAGSARTGTDDDWTSF